MAAAARSARRARSPRPETRPPSYRAAFRPGVPWPGRLCGRRARKKARPQRARRAWPCLFFWAAQAAQTLAPQGLAGASARPRRPGGRTAARACAGKAAPHTAPTVCGGPAGRVDGRAPPMPGKTSNCNRWMSCPVPAAPRAASGGVGAGAGGRRLGAPDWPLFRLPHKRKERNPVGSALFQKGGRFRAVLRHVSTLPRFSRPVKRQSLPSCALPP